MENKDKAYLEAFSCRAFLWGKRLPLRARYLLFQLVRLYSLELPGKTTIGGVQPLAQDTGFSKGGVSRNLKLLVNQGVLVLEQEATRGRSKTVYRLDTSIQQVLSTPWSMMLLAPWLSRILIADEPPFNALSISERSLLAFVWGQVKSPRVCVLDGQSVSTLAKKVGVDKSTFNLNINELSQKGMLVPSDAAFAVDGKANKTKTYFLLGPAVVNCWPQAFTWRVSMEADAEAQAVVKEQAKAVLRWFWSGSGKYSSESLLVRVERWAPRVSGDWRVVRNKLPALWDAPGVRHYALMQSCAALSHAFSSERTILWYARILYEKIQSALLRVLGLPIAGADAHHAAIEEVDLKRFTDEQQALCLFAEQLSTLLIDALKTIFPVVLHPQELGKGVGLLSCYPVVVADTQQLRIDLVTDDEVAGAKFGAYLLSENKRSGLELPEQLQAGAKC
ncbi:hypothetical protein [Pseudomonas knackmussii]|uniref:hypothetical protein n=1 Tax=Pseudomonas knackmussii TaxID=65741 RepID=UPI003F49F354